MQTGSVTIESIAIFALCLIVAITVHEFMHGLIAFRQGDDTAHNEGRLTLNPLKSVDPVYSILLPLVTFIFFKAPILAAKPVPVTPWKLREGAVGMAKVGIAGPLSNLLMAFVTAFVIRLIDPTGVLYAVLYTFVQINIGLFVFNILPIPPLDGSRVLYAFLPQKGRDILDQIEPYGFYIIIALVLLGAFGGVLGAMFGFIDGLMPYGR